MKKILFAILSILMLGLVANVGAVPGSLSWNLAGTVLPTTVTMAEDTTYNLLGDLNQYVANSETTTFSSIGSTNIAVTFAVNVPTLTPNANWHGTEVITFLASDSDDIVQSASVQITVANDNTDFPTVTGITPSSPNINEDTSIAITLLGQTPVGIITYSIVTPPIQGSVSIIDQVLDRLTYTPNSNYNGQDSFSFKATNEDGDSTAFIVNININPINDAPIISVITDKTVSEDILITNIVLNPATDPDVGDVITYALDFVGGIQPTASTFSLTFFNPVTRTISGWIPIKQDIGELKLTLTATDSFGLTDTEVFTINIYPEIAACDIGEIGKLKITDIEIRDDELIPGNEIEFDIDVDNNFNEDLKVIVEVIIYNLDEHKTVVREKSDSIRIDFSEDETFNVKLKLEADEKNIGENDDYIAFVKAYERSNEDIHCNEETEDDFDIERLDDHVIIEEAILSPQTLTCGEEGRVSIGVINAGLDDQNTYIRLLETKLKIDETSSQFNLEEFDGDDNSALRILNFKIPETADEKDYQLETIVYFNGGKDTESQFLTLTVNNCLESTSSITSGDIVVQESTGASTAFDTTTGFVPISNEPKYLNVLLIAGMVVLLLVIILLIKMVMLPKRIV